jgi:hypothetical protein
MGQAVARFGGQMFRTTPPGVWEKSNGVRASRIRKWSRILALRMMSIFRTRVTMCRFIVALSVG